MLYLQLGWIFRYFCVSSGTNSSLLKPTAKMSKPLISSHLVIAVLMNLHYEHSFLNFILSIHVQSIKNILMPLLQKTSNFATGFMGFGGSRFQRCQHPLFWGEEDVEKQAKLSRGGRSNGEPSRRDVFSHSQKVLAGLTITTFLQTGWRNYTPTFVWLRGVAWNTAPHPMYWAAILWRDKKMSFLVIYVSNSESTSTGFSSQRDFIFVGTSQGQRLQFQNFTQEKKKQKRWKTCNTILATSNTAPIATISNFLVSLAHTRAQVLSYEGSIYCLVSLPQHSWWMLHCLRCVASSPRHLELLPPEDKTLRLQQGVNNESEEQWTRISFRQINGRIEAERKVWNGR